MTNCLHLTMRREYTDRPLLFFRCVYMAAIMMIMMLMLMILLRFFSGGCCSTQSSNYSGFLMVLYLCRTDCFKCSFLNKIVMTAILDFTFDQHVPYLRILKCFFCDQREYF